MSREWKWQRLGRPCEIYEDARRVDGPVLPEFPIPICDCGCPAGVMQSRDEDTIARAYYCCVDYRVSAITMHLLLCYVYLLMLKLGLQDLDFWSGAISSNGSTVLKKGIIGILCFRTWRVRCRTTGSAVGCPLHRTQ